MFLLLFRLLLLLDLCFPERMKAAHEAAVKIGIDDMESKSQARSSSALVVATKVSTAKKKQLRILLVHESSAARRDDEAMLTNYGHVVLTASSGSEASNIIRKFRIEAAYASAPKEASSVSNSSSNSISSSVISTGFDLVLMSNLVTGHSAAHTIYYIRQQGFKGLVIVMANEVGSEEVRDMRASGADCIIPDPLKMKSFQRALRGENSLVL